MVLVCAAWKLTVDGSGAEPDMLIAVAGAGRMLHLMMPGAGPARSPNRTPPL
jgi:hypothetical protein